MKNNTNKAPVHVERSRDMAVNIYRAPSRGYESYAMTYYSGGKRRVSRARSLEAAKTKAKSIIQQISSGAGRIAILNPIQVVDYLEAAKTVRTLGLARLVDMTEDYAAARSLLPSGTTLRAAAAEYRKAHDRKAKLASVTVSDLVAKLVAAKEAERLSWRYCEDVKMRLKPFAQAFKCQIGSVTAAEIIEWLDRAPLPRQLASRALGKLTYSLYVPKALNAKRTTLPEALRTLPLALPAAGRIRTVLDEHIGENSRAVVGLPGFDACLALLRTGRYASALPDVAVAAPETKSYLRLPLDLVGIKGRTYSLVWSKRSAENRFWVAKGVELFASLFRFG